MSIREIDIAQFSEFARKQIEAGRGDVSLTALAEQWERHQKSNGTSSSSQQHPNAQVARARAYVDELARQQGVQPVRSAADIRFDFLDSTEELDEFLTAVKAGRHEDSFKDPLND